MAFRWCAVCEQADYGVHKQCVTTDWVPMHGWFRFRLICMRLLGCMARCRHACMRLAPAMLWRAASTLMLRTSCSLAAPGLITPRLVAVLNLVIEL